MTAPGGLHLADLTGIDEILHRAHHGEVAHVMPHVKLATRFHRAAQNAVATFHGDAHRLFQINRFSGQKGGDGMLLMQIIRRSHDHRADLRPIQHLAEIGRLEAAEFKGKPSKQVRIDVGRRSNTHSGRCIDRLFREDSSSKGNSDNPDGEAFCFWYSVHGLSNTPQ